jgi:hypothetical protein
MGGVVRRGNRPEPPVSCEWELMGRYSKAADWEYIAECAALIKRAKEEMAEVIDSSYQNLEYGTTQQMAFIGYTSHYIWF